MHKLLFITLLLFSITGYSQDNERSDENLDQQVDETLGDFAGMGGMNKQGEIVVDENEKVEPVEIKDSPFTSMMDPKTKLLLGKMMKKSPFADLKKEAIESLMLAKLQGTPVGGVLEKNERLRKSLVDFLKHEKALPNLIGLINKPDKLKTFGIFVIVIFIIAFVLNLKNSKGNIFRKILIKISISFGVIILQIGGFLFLFREELEPTLSIVFKYFHI